MFFLPILIVVIMLSLIVVILMTMGSKKGAKLRDPKKKKAKGRDVILKEANKRLSQNPKDPEGLLALGDLLSHASSTATEKRTRSR